jgi:hypothetical protein
LDSIRREAGGCGCGAIRFEVVDEPIKIAVCHCEDCRRLVGAQSVAWFVLPRANFRISSGDPVAHASSPDVIRTFCGSCGTSLTYTRTSRADTIDVTIASMDNPARFRPSTTTYESERIEWCSPI